MNASQSISSAKPLGPPVKHPVYGNVPADFYDLCKRHGYPVESLTFNTKGFIHAILNDICPENRTTFYKLSAFHVGKRQWNLLYCYLMAQLDDELEAIKITQQVNTALSSQ